MTSLFLAALCAVPAPAGTTSSRAPILPAPPKLAAPATRPDLAAQGIPAQAAAQAPRADAQLSLAAEPAGQPPAASGETAKAETDQAFTGSSSEAAAPESAAPVFAAEASRAAPPLPPPAPTAKRPSAFWRNYPALATLGVAGPIGAGTLFRGGLNTSFAVIGLTSLYGSAALAMLAYGLFLGRLGGQMHASLRITLGILAAAAAVPLALYGFFTFLFTFYAG